MHTQMVMTVIGADHPGLVEAVSAVITQHGGNWLESRMARLEGQFAGLVHVAVPTERSGDLHRALRDLEHRGLTVVIAEARAAGSAVAQRARLELTGHDHPGIVHRVSEAIARTGGNIVEWSTTVTTSPMSGAPLFTATGLIELAGADGAPSLQAALEALAADLMVDIAIAPATE